MYRFKLRKIAGGAVIAAIIAIYASMAVGQSAGNSRGSTNFGLKHDTSLPLEITADRLEVAQQDQTAVFVGNVVATQGELILRADSLRVYYRSGGSAADAGGVQGAISRLDAIGNVTMTSPGEAANSEWAVYDVDAGLLTLGGSVGLTRGENIIRGEQLVVDLNSGLSRVVGTEGGSGRVKGLFVPAQNGDRSRGTP